MNDKFAKSRIFYDAVSDWFDEEYYGFDVDPVIEFDVRQISKLLRKEIPSSSRVLEIGTGTGHWLRFLMKERSCTVYGLDYSVAMVRQSRKRGTPNCVVADAAYVPFWDSFFDVVISPFSALNHCPNYANAFSEISRVCKPGGKIVLMVDNADRNISTYWKTIHPDIEPLGMDSENPNSWRQKVKGEEISVFTRFFSKGELRALLSDFDIRLMGLGSALPHISLHFRRSCPRFARSLVQILSPIELVLNRYIYRRSAFLIAVGLRVAK